MLADGNGQFTKALGVELDLVDKVRRRLVVGRGRWLVRALAAGWLRGRHGFLRSYRLARELLAAPLAGGWRAWDVLRAPASC